MSIQHNERKTKRLTIDELKKHKGFENYTAEESEATIFTLEKLSVLFYELYLKSIQEETTEKELAYEDQSKFKKSNITKKIRQRKRGYSE